jgi:hypothetical protein
MKIALRISKAVAAVALAMPIVAGAQMVGTSHPDDTPIANSPAIARSPMEMVETQQKAPAATLKPRPGISADATTAPATFTVIGKARAVEPEGKQTQPVDLDAGIVTRIAGPSNQLPVGTLVKVVLGQNISTTQTAAGTLFTAKLVESVQRDGKVLIPVGSTLSGMVTDIHGGKRISGPATLHLRTIAVTLPDGTRYDLRGQVIDTSLSKNVKVDREGTIMGKDHAAKSAATMTLTTGSGAATGALIGGVPGALIGAGVGAGISTVVWLRQDRQADLPPNTTVTFSLTEALTVGAQ